MKTKPANSEKCALCFKPLHPCPIDIVDDLLEDLQFLNNKLDVDLIQKYSACRNCVKNVGLAYEFKTYYVSAADKNNSITDKEEPIIKKEIEWEELIKCHICKSFEHYCLPLSSIIEKNKITTIVECLGEGINDNSLACGSCQASLTNLGDVLTLLSVYNEVERVEIDELTVTAEQFSKNIAENTPQIDKITSSSKSSDVKMECEVGEVKLLSPYNSDTKTTKLMKQGQFSKNVVENTSQTDQIASAGPNGALSIKTECTEAEVKLEPPDINEYSSDTETVKPMKQSRANKSNKRKVDTAQSPSKKTKNYQPIKNHGNQYTAFKCQICFCKFQRATQLKEHLKTHLEKDSYACPRCNFLADRFEYLQCHLLIHKVIDDNKIPPDQAVVLLSKKHVSS